MDALKQRSSWHYLGALALFSLYGVQVCPFLDSLSTVQLFLPILVIFGAQWALRLWMEKRIAQQHYKQQVKQQFLTDLGLFSVSGILLGAFNTIVYGFPLESAVRC